MSITAWLIGTAIAASLLSSKNKELDSHKLLSKQGDKMFDEAWEKRQKRANKKNAYDVLGIEPTATSEEIKTAYKAMVKKYHPDHNNSKNAASQFRVVKKAYDILKDKEKKAEYDANLLPRAKKVLLVGFSVQQLRLTLAEHMKIDSKTIKFTQTGDVFINDEFSACWCEFGGFFVYYEPQTPKNIKFDDTIHEIIFLTSYNKYELEEMIAINFGCMSSAIELEYEGFDLSGGIVLKYGEYALCWREINDDYYEYYCPTVYYTPEGVCTEEDDFDNFDFSGDEDDDLIPEIELSPEKAAEESFKKMDEYIKKHAKKKDTEE